MTDLLSPRSGRIKAARRLADRRTRGELQRFLVEGPQLLAEALATDGTVLEVYATPAAAERYAELQSRTDVPWQLADEPALRSLSDTVTPTGLVAVCDATRVLRPAAEATPPEARLVALCADIRDPGNAGAIIRCADAAGADAVLLAGESVDPLNPKVVRASVGSLFHLPIARAGSVAETTERLQSEGFSVLAATGHGDVDLFEADGLLSGRTVWLFGNEAHGLPAELADRADHRVRIPIFGRAESLNLGAAAAVCLYASARAHRPASGR